MLVIGIQLLALLHTVHCFCVILIKYYNAMGHLALKHIAVRAVMVINASFFCCTCYLPVHFKLFDCTFIYDAAVIATLRVNA